VSDRATQVDDKSQQDSVRAKSQPHRAISENRRR
jgi:hypothetical protein